jgi:hypothetical protein
VTLELTFPAKRYERGGATPEEIAQLSREWSHSDAAARYHQLEYLGSIADSDIAEYIEDLRAEGHFSPPKTDESEDTAESGGAGARTDADSESGATDEDVSPGDPEVPESSSEGASAS